MNKIGETEVYTYHLNEKVFIDPDGKVYRCYDRVAEKRVIIKTDNGSVEVRKEIR